VAWRWWYTINGSNVLAEMVVAEMEKYLPALPYWRWGGAERNGGSGIVLS